MLVIGLVLAQISWYSERTYTDPWRHGYLIGEVTLNDFMMPATGVQRKEE
jgi:hypothetical protein